MAIAVFTSFEQLTNATGTILNGGSVTVYQAGTTTPISLFSDTALSVGVSNPITLDSAGRHAMTYFATQAYKVLVKDSGGSTVFTRDNIDPGVPVGTGALPIANGGTGATSAPTALSNLGGATTAEVADIAADLAALSGTLASTEKTHIATGTTGQRAASPIQGDIRYNTSIGTEGIIEFYDGAEWRNVSFSQPPTSAFKNLVIKVASNTTVTVTADFVIVSNGTLTQTVTPSSTINMATTGSDALDAGSIAIDTWYFVWVIAKPDGTVKCLASTSSTAPTMPSGYTYKARIGAVQTIHGSATLYGTWQFGRRAAYVVGLAQTSALPMMAVANAGSTTVPTWVAIALARFVPTTAAAIDVSCMTSGANGVVMVAPNNSYGAFSSTSNPPPMTNVYNGVGNVVISKRMLLESTNIYYAAATGSAVFVACLGWEDNI